MVVSQAFTAGAPAAASGTDAARNTVQTERKMGNVEIGVCIMARSDCNSEPHRLAQLVSLVPGLGAGGGRQYGAFAVTERCTEPHHLLLIYHRTVYYYA